MNTGMMIRMMAVVLLTGLGGSAEEARTNSAPVFPALTGVASPVPAVTNKPVAVATNAVPLGAGKAAIQPDPMVGKVVLALASHLQSAKTFRCDVSFLINSEMEGMKQEISATYALAVEKPNRLALRFVKGMTGNTVVCSGKNLVTYAPSLNRYQESAAPNSLEQFAQGTGALSGNMLFVDNLIRDDVYAAIMDGVVKVTYAGRDLVDGVECDHLKFVQDQFDWELWVTIGMKPVVIQVLNDMSKGLGAMTGEGGAPKGMRMTVLNRFTNWVVDSALPADTFEFKPPAGARKTDSLFEGEDDDPAEHPVPPGMDDLKTTNKMEWVK